MSRLFPLLVSLALLFPGCCKKETVKEGTPPPAGAFCGFSAYGPCSDDADCVRAGCSRQVCISKEEGAVVTTCEWRDCYDPAPYKLACACVNGSCAWAPGRPDEGD